MTQKLLLQKSSGCVYPWSADLAAMPDMVDYEPKPKAAPVVEPVVEAPAPVEAEPVQDDIKAVARAVLTKRKSK